MLSLLALQQVLQAQINTAKVERIQGILIFTDSEPTNAYDYIKTVKRNTGGFGCVQYTCVRDALIKIAKKENENFNALIIHLSKGQADKADLIFIKQE